MDREAIKDFIAARKQFVWYVKDPRNLSNDAIVEAVLNYGDWDDVQELIRILGIDTVAEIFERRSNQRRCNYNQKTKHYFHLYFQKHAPRNTHARAR